MDTRHLNTTNRTRGIITKNGFLTFEQVRKSGKQNMFGFNTDIQRGENYKNAYNWFVINKKETDLQLDEKGLVVVE